MKAINEINKILKKLYEERKELYLKEDRREIRSDKYERLLTELNKKINFYNQEKMFLMNKELKEKFKETEQKEFLKQPEQVKKKKKPKYTYTDLILKALMHPKVDTEDKVVEIVYDKKPDTHKENIRSQVRNIISIIKNKKNKKFKDYQWDLKTYSVIKTNQVKL